jgi:hypothetical protein
MKYYTLTLGCQMNMSDSERLNKVFENMGFERTEIEQEADVLGIIACSVRQKAIEYLVQTLEPRGYDSFFSWNFFDEILFRNEYFSPYIFEETAEDLLKNDRSLKKEFEQQKKADPAFAENGYRQLRYIYERSPWSEKSYMRYPVYRMDRPF